MLTASATLPISSHLEVVHIFRQRRTALLADWQTEVPFDSMYDIEEEETDDIDKAMYVVIKISDDWWCSIELASAPDPVLH